jgi:multidrug efflux pump subunit AcrA (membrane-fusion protein)
MARLEIEIDDAKGEIVGDVPEALKGIFARIESTTHQQAFGKGAAKAAEEAKAQIAKAVADERARMDAEAPLRAEKYERIEGEYKTLQTRLLEQEREHDRTLKSAGETHARELLDRSDRLKKFGGRIMDLTKAQLRGEARAAGARDESLDELEVILHSSIGYTDDMEPFVKTGEGAPRTAQGKPMSISSFVKEYLDGHSHHKRPTQGSGGGARGGASFHGHSANVSADAAKARVEGGDRSSGAVNDLYEATRQKRG